MSQELLSASKYPSIYFHFRFSFFLNMTKNTKLDEKLEGAENFRAWKYRIMLILQENDLDQFVKEEVKEPEEAKAKAKHKKDMIIPKRIIVDSIKDNLIPQVSSMETPKEIFNSLSSLFEGRHGCAHYVVIVCLSDVK